MINLLKSKKLRQHGCKWNERIGQGVKTGINAITQGSAVMTNKREITMTINEHFINISKTMNLSPEYSIKGWAIKKTEVTLLDV